MPVQSTDDSTPKTDVMLKTQLGVGHLPFASHSANLPTQLWALRKTWKPEHRTLGTLVLLPLSVLICRLKGDHNEAASWLQNKPQCLLKNTWISTVRLGSDSSDFTTCTYITKQAPLPTPNTHDNAYLTYKQNDSDTCSTTLTTHTDIQNDCHTYTHTHTYSSHTNKMTVTHAQ